jgi:hypothetical protein
MYTKGKGRMPAATRTFVKQNQIRVQIIAQRHSKKQKYQAANDSRPFLDRVAARRWVLRPAHPPDAQREDGYQHPKKIEK